MQCSHLYSPYSLPFGNIKQSCWTYSESVCPWYCVSHRIHLCIKFPSIGLHLYFCFYLHLFFLLFVGKFIKKFIKNICNRPTLRKMPEDPCHVGLVGIGLATARSLLSLSLAVILGRRSLDRLNYSRTQFWNVFWNGNEVLHLRENKSAFEILENLS